MNRPPYVAGAALTEGLAAHVVNQLLAHHLGRFLLAMSSEQRAELIAYREAVRRANNAYLARPRTDMADMSVADIPAASPVEIDTDEAAALLHVTPRQARRLAEAGLGRKAGGRWLLDREAVVEYGRRSA